MFVSLLTDDRHPHSIWEKKYGRNANHVKKQETTDPRNVGSRNAAKKPFGKASDVGRPRPPAYTSNAPRPQASWSRPSAPSGSLLHLSCSYYLDAVCSSRSAGSEDRRQAATSFLGSKAEAERQTKSWNSGTAGQKDCILGDGFGICTTYVRHIQLFVVSRLIDVFVGPQVGRCIQGSACSKTKSYYIDATYSIYTDYLDHMPSDHICKASSNFNIFSGGIVKNSQTRRWHLRERIRCTGIDVVADEGPLYYLHKCGCGCRFKV